MLDSTGLSIVGAGEWAAAKHGGRGRRGWRKLHLGVDQSGVILVHTLTKATGEDATTGLDLLTAVEGPLVRVTADAAYQPVVKVDRAAPLLLARRSTGSIPLLTLWRMAMRTRDPEQPPLWIAASDLPVSPGHPFYTRLNALLDADGFDTFVEDACASRIPNSLAESRIEATLRGVWPPPTRYAATRR